MAAAGTVAVLLPGAFYALNEKKKPPVQLLRDVGVPIAIATDCNPGTYASSSMPLMIALAVREMHLTPAEALHAATAGAAHSTRGAPWSGVGEIDG